MATESGQAVEFLEALGLTEHEARALYSLFARPDATPSEISQSSGITLNKVYPALESLEGKGLVRCTPSRPKRYRPLEPQAVLDALMRRQEAKLAVMRECRESATSLLGNFHNGAKEAAWAGPGIEAVRSAAMREIALAKRTLKLVVAGRSWHIMFREPQSAEAVMRPLSRGVSVYSIVPSSVIAGPDSLAGVPDCWLKAFAHGNFNARIVDDAKIRNAFMIVDDERAGLALSNPDTGSIRSGIGVLDIAAVRDMADCFARLWDGAAPAEGRLRETARSLLKSDKA